MLEIIFPILATTLACVMGYALGILHTNREHQRRNAATARCVACEWVSGPVPLADAFKAARAHESVNGREGHPALVVRA